MSKSIDIDPDHQQPETDTAVKPNQTGPPPARKLLTVDEVCARVRVGKTAVYKAMKQGTPLFPRPVRISTSSFWVESEIDAYIDSLILQRVAS